MQGILNICLFTPSSLPHASETEIVPERILAGHSPEGVYLFKASDRKLVFRFNVPGEAGGSVIAKVRLRNHLEALHYVLRQALMSRV